MNANSLFLLFMFLPFIGQMLMFADNCDECGVHDHGGDDDASGLHIGCLRYCDRNGVVVDVV